MSGLQYLQSLRQWQGVISDDWSLRPMERLMEALDNPQRRYRTIHIAGTNGKGSVSTMVAAALAATGAHVGLNISPHLVRQNERIVVDGLPIADSILDSAAAKLANAAKVAGVEPSYFEAITAVAFLVFAEQRVSWAVIEVGLGGRLDATNIITPEIGAIVSIGLDHEHILGTTTAAIAAEKAGIVKRGMDVVVGAMDSGATNVVTRAIEAVGARGTYFGVDFDTYRPSDSCVGVNLKGGGSVELQPPLRGSHQLGNIAVAAQVAALAGVSPAHIKAGVEGAFWPARLEYCPGLPRPVWIDSAHNPAGIETVAQFIKEERYHKVSVVFGALEVKSWQEMIGLLIPFVNQWYLAEPDYPKALPCAILASHLSSIGVTPRSFERDYDALFKECLFDSVEPLFIVGSIYLVGKLRARLGVPERTLWKVKK